MKNNVFGILALLVACATAVIGIWTRPAKVGYAETSVLLTSFNEAVAARKEFEKSQKEWDKNLKTLNDSLLASMETMKKSYETAGKAGRDSMRSALKEKNDDLQRYTNAVKKLSTDREKELMEPVIKKMNSFLAVWGKAHGYDLILGTLTGGNILQANENINLTSRILADLNEEYRDSSPAVEKTAVSRVDNGKKIAPPAASIPVTAKAD